MIFGLNSSGWASRWPLEQLLEHAREAGILGVELQLGDDHGVAVELDEDEREQVGDAFATFGVEPIGIATDYRVDDADEEAYAAAREKIEQVMRLSHDVNAVGVTLAARQPPDGGGGGGVERLGNRLRELATFGERWGQQVRLELREEAAELATARAIFDAADHHNVYLAWASEPANLSGEGVEHDYGMLRPHLGETVYVGPLDDDAYPYFNLLQLLKDDDYLYWVVLRSEGEAPANVADVLNQQHRLFSRIIDPGRDTELRFPR